MAQPTGHCSLERCEQHHGEKDVGTLIIDSWCKNGSAETCGRVETGNSRVWIGFDRFGRLSCCVQMSQNFQFPCEISTCKVQYLSCERKVNLSSYHWSVLLRIHGRPQHIVDYMAIWCYLDFRQELVTIFPDFPGAAKAPVWKPWRWNKVRKLQRSEVTRMDQDSISVFIGGLRWLNTC